jgi:hypothetical protein
LLAVVQIVAGVATVMLPLPSSVVTSATQIHAMVFSVFPSEVFVQAVGSEHAPLVVLQICPALQYPMVSHRHSAAL